MFFQLTIDTSASEKSDKNVNKYVLYIYLSVYYILTYMCNMYVIFISILARLLVLRNVAAVLIAQLFMYI